MQPSLVTHNPPNEKAPLKHNLILSKNDLIFHYAQTLHYIPGHGSIPFQAFFHSLRLSFHSPIICRFTPYPTQLATCRTLTKFPNVPAFSCALTSNCASLRPKRWRLVLKLLHESFRGGMRNASSLILVYYNGNSNNCQYFKL